MAKLCFTALVILALAALGCSEAAQEKPPEEAEAKAEMEKKEPAPRKEDKPEPEKEAEKEASENAQKEVGEEKEKEPEQEPQEIEVGVIETDFGKIVIEFYPDLAPKTVTRIKELIGKGFYNGLIFHRVVPGFCIQGGCPDGTGSGGTGQNIPGEFSTKQFADGSVGMARSNDPNSNDCQFFITLGRASNLDGQYTLFGHVIEGLDVAHKIAGVPAEGPEGMKKPKEEVCILGFSLEKRKKEK